MNADASSAEPDVPPRQVNLHLGDLREVFRAVDRLAARRMGDREIYASVKSSTPHFQDAFVRWLVRHTLHPEAEDDIMPDEVLTIRKRAVGNGVDGLEVHLRRVPPTVRPYLLVQYRNQFWHVVNGPTEEGHAVLRPLATLPE